MTIKETPNKITAVLKVTATAEFFDDEASEETVRYAIEQDLEDAGFDVNVVALGADSGMCEICSFYERAMPIKPHYNARTNWYECGACHYSMTSGMHCKGELIPAYKVGFCAKCGKAVMWE